MRPKDVKKMRRMERGNSMMKKEWKQSQEKKRRVEPEQPIKRVVYQRLCDIEMFKRY